MTHQRIGKFNMREIYPNQTVDNDLCQAVVTNHAVYLSVQAPFSDDGELVGKGDPTAESEQAMRNVTSLLGEAGCTMSDVVKITHHLTDRANREPVY